LYEELKRLFNKKNIDEITQEEMKHNIAALQQIHDKVTELNRKNNLLKAKYKNDAKYARIHKRIAENGKVSKRELAISDSLMAIKQQADDKVLNNSRLLNNEGYFSDLMMPMVIDGFDKIKIELDIYSADYINSCLVKEYINEYQGVVR
jgi:type I restriction enzyme R subunit